MKNPVFLPKKTCFLTGPTISWVFVALGISSIIYIYVMIVKAC